MTSLNNLITSGKFDLEHSNLLKKFVPSYFGYYPKSQFDANTTEREVENNKIIYDLKEGIFYNDDIVNIGNDIKSKIDIDNIDFITITPDSGNTSGGSEIKGFSLFVNELANYLGKEIIYPEIVKKMGKQKEQSVYNRIGNRRGGYEFDYNDIFGKNILFIDDVITSGATMLSIGENIVNNSGNFFAYSIAHSEMDRDKR